MRIYYHLSGYLSHRKAGQAYRACIEAIPGGGFTLVDDPAQADMAIFHDEPPAYAALLGQYPVLRALPKAAYCVWETDILPEQYAEGLRLVDRVWTCSDFSLAAIAPLFRASRVLPHVVERLKPGREALAWAMEKVGRSPGQSGGPHLFLSIIDARNPRKNLPGLLAAFAAAFPGNQPGAAARGQPAANLQALLVLKQYRHEFGLEGIPGVLVIPEHLEEERIAALHAVCDTYVSAHHAEAWGLPLSEAMSMGKRVIATGYSGNMQFMDAHNSVPISYTLVPVPQVMVDASPLFTTTMRWADINGPALATAMRRAALRPPEPRFAERVYESMRRFSPQAVSLRLKELLEEFQRTIA